METEGKPSAYGNVYEIATRLPQPRPNDETLKTGGGGGNSGDMERRLALVEDAVKELRRDVGDIKVDMATLKERVSHLPGKGFIVSVSLTSLGILAALITFADKIHAAMR